MRISRSIPHGLALACVAWSACGHAAAQASQPLAGTYRIAVCRSACEPGDTAHALAYGVLVLNDRPIDPRTLPDSVREVMQVSLDDLDAYAESNACFALTRGDHAQTNAGIAPAGLTEWEKQPGGSITVVLYQSPDDGYRAVLHAAASGLRGHGRSWGYDIAAGEVRDDSVAAVRTGPPDPSLCAPSRKALARIQATVAHFDSLLARARPRDPDPPTTEAPPFAAVTVGGAHACALAADGRAYCWGENGHGTLGDGTQTDRSAAVPVAGGLRFTALSTGREATCGINGGQAWCWGTNTLGRLGVGSAPDRCFQDECSLRPLPVAGGLRFRDISVGALHACALTEAGEAYCWGSNMAGALGTQTDYVQKTPVPVQGGLRFASISAGEGFTCALTAEGAAYCWGADGEGQLGDGDAPPACRGGYAEPCRWAPVAVAGGLRFRSVAANGGSACGITVEGDAYCWGADARDVPTDLADPGPPTREPVRVPGTVRFSAIVPPPTQGPACGVDERGGAWCWGRGNPLFLSDNPKPRRTPVALAAGHAFRTVGLGYVHACGLEAGGAVFCWGSNRSGQLGNGHTSPSDPPSRVLLRR